MGIDSLGKTTGVPQTAATAERKEGATVPKAVEGASASRVDLSVKRFDSAIKAATKELTAADEARLDGLRQQIASGEYSLNPADIARSVMEDRAFFAALTSDED
jgi:anti-sigma28 factor (negative regulator of flagellin synthesis)